MESTQPTLYGMVTVADFIIITGHFQHLILTLSMRLVVGFLLFRLSGSAFSSAVAVFDKLSP